MRAGRSLLIILIVLIFACSFLFIFSTPLLKKLANGLVVSDKIQNSDAVLVLGGSSPARVLEAIDIHNDGQADKILITRGGSPEGADFLRSRNITFPEEADLNIFVAGEMGLDKNDLLILPGRVYLRKKQNY